jgi:hypothetical protein
MKTKPNYLILFLLALVFASPGFFAYLYYQNPEWLGSTTTNKGALLRPPLLLTELGKATTKWRLLYWYPDNCEANCLQTMDKLARVRLALGRRLYQVDEYLVLPRAGQKTLEDIKSRLSENDIKVLALSGLAVNRIPVLNDKPRLFIANPSGYLVLTYEPEADPKDIYHDIKQLLTS